MKSGATPIEVHADTPAVRSRSALRPVGRGLAAALALYLTYLVVIMIVQRDLVFPGASFDPIAPAAPEGVERWQRAHEDVTIEALFVPHPEATSAAPRPLLVLFHGNGDYAESMTQGALVYRKMGFHVLVPEYRGYNHVPGEPSEAAIAADTAVLLEEALARRDVDPARVVYHGISLGGGVAGAVARSRPPTAMVLQSTFTSVRDMASRFYAPGFLARDPFDTLSVVGTLHAPIYVIHGHGDRVVPFSMGEALAAAAPRATFAAFDGGHAVPTPTDELRYWKSIAAFLRDAGVLERRD